MTLGIIVWLPTGEEYAVEVGETFSARELWRRHPSDATCRAICRAPFGARFALLSDVRLTRREPRR